MGVDVDLEETTCEVLVKGGEAIGCKVWIALRSITDLVLPSILRFVEQRGYGEVKFNMAMTRATVMLSLKFD